MSKKKPNYTQYMKRPAPLELSPPSDHDDRPIPTVASARKNRVSEEELPWGEVIVEFGPHDSAPLQISPARPAQPAAPGREKVSIPFGTIVEGAGDHQPPRTAPAPDAARPGDHRATPTLPPSRQTVPSGAGAPRADEVTLLEQEAQPGVGEFVEPQSGFFEHVPGPPLGVMVMAVAVVVILFLLVQST